jgi:hypothetical protein
LTISSDISLFWLLPWLAICILIVHFYYRNNQWFSGLNTSVKLVLKGLRVLILFFVGLLLFGLILQKIDYRVEKPVIILLSDKSSSMKNYKDSNEVMRQINGLQSSLSEQLSEDYELVNMTVGANVEYQAVPNFKDATSDLSKGFEKINTDFYNRNVGAVIFVSDGNFNAGVNPVYEAEKISFTPVYTLAVGDTIPKRDQYIKNVATNDVTFLKNKFPVEVDVEAVKMGKGTTSVSILRGGKVLQSQNISYKDGKHDFEHVTFLLDADRVGFQTYSVSVSNESNEYNYKNNSRIFYIEVIDSRSKVLVLSGAPHPDIAAIKQTIEQDENLEVKAELLKEWNRDLKKVDLVVWHEPGVGFDPAVNSLLLEKKIPILYCVGPNSSSSVVTKLNIGANVTGSNQFDETQGGWNTSFQQFEVGDELKKAIGFFPPLKTKFGEIKLTGGAEIAIFQKVGPVLKKDPLLYFNKRDNSKYGVIYGEGIWKWRVNDYVRNGSFDNFNELIQKVTQYLLVKQNTSALRVNLPKRFTKDEDILVNATFYNESMEEITKPTITMIVTNESGKTFKREFAKSGDMYKLALGQLNPGKYNWQASASYNGKVYKKNGVFVVEDIELESVDTYSNQQVLRQLASKTKGKFDFLRNYQKTIENIKSRDDIASVSYEETVFNELIDYKILFFLLLFLLTLEWFMRRWLGSY